MELVTSAVIEASLPRARKSRRPERWLEVMEALSESATDAYRVIVHELPRFTDYFNEAKDRRFYMAQSSQELRDTQAKLIQQEKMATLGSVVAGISPEISTPIGVISSGPETLSRAVQKLVKVVSLASPELAGDKTVQATVRVISSVQEATASAAGRVTEIVKRLGAFANLDQADQTPTDLREGIENTLLLVAHQLNDRIRVVKELGPIPKIIGHPGQLNQVFLNLIANAIEAIDEQGTVTIRMYAREEQVFVEVEDDGRGRIVNFKPHRSPRAGILRLWKLC